MLEALHHGGLGRRPAAGAYAGESRRVEELEVASHLRTLVMETSL